MTERWRRPARVLSAEASGEAIVTNDGRIQRNVELVLDRETVERVRLGYLCAKCFEPFPVPWPRRCNVCGAPIARDQREFFHREFTGEVPLGSRTSIEDELARLREYKEEP